MAMIVPTVEAIGDETLTNSIIDRSISEIQDNLSTIVGSSTFYKCPALKKAVFGLATEVKAFAFRECAALTTVDFHAAESLGSSCFYKSSALETLIIRTPSVCNGSAAIPFTGTAIQNGTGYIYVPAALVDSYKADSGWSTYANQIRAIEDYPEVCDPYSWEAVSYHIENGTYKDVYKIGDTVPVDLGSEGIINMQIAAFDADTLADGSGTAAISWVGKELLATKQAWGPSTYVSWGAGGSLRSYLQNDIRALIPEKVAAMIKSVKKSHQNGSATNTEMTMDDVWVPSLYEVYESTRKYKALFPDNESRKKVCVGTTQYSAWWMRDRVSSSGVSKLTSSGSKTSTAYTTNPEGVCLGFCTGVTPT